MPGPWVDTTERQLLLIMLHLTMPKLPDWDEVAGLMGDAFTASACRQHFQKLRNEAKKEFGEPGVAPKSTPPKGTPRKKPVGSPAAKTNAKAKAAASKGKGKASTNGKRKAHDEDSDDEVEEPATKRVHAIKEESEEEAEELS